MNILTSSESVRRSHQLKVSFGITILIIAALVVTGSPTDNQYYDTQDFGYGYGYGYASTTNTANIVNSGSNEGTYPIDYYTKNQGYAAIEAMKKAEKEDARKRLIGVEPGEYGYHAAPGSPGGIAYRDIPMTYTNIQETPIPTITTTTQPTPSPTEPINEAPGFDLILSGLIISIVYITFRGSKP